MFASTSANVRRIWAIIARWANHHCAPAIANLPLLPLLASIIFAGHATAAFVESGIAGQGKALQAPLPLAAPVTSSKAFSPQGDDPGWLRCCAQWRPTPYGMADFSQPARWAWTIMVTFPGKA
jgi:hypothetical protein